MEVLKHNKERLHGRQKEAIMVAVTQIQFDDTEHQIRKLSWLSFPPKIERWRFPTGHFNLNL
jgi:hypothetical protein